MRYVFTILFIVLALNVSVKSNTDNIYLETKFISNPYNDKEVILTGTYNTGVGEDPIFEYYSCVMSLDSDSTRVFKINLNPGNEVLDVALHSDSESIAFVVGGGKCLIYNYKTGNEVNSFSLRRNFNPLFSKIGFSSDGSTIYISDIEFLGVDKYDISSGDLSGQQFRITTSNSYESAYINSDRNEVAFLTGTTLEIYSLESNNLVNSLQTDPGTDNIKFLDNGEKMVYHTDDEVFIRDATTGDTIFVKSFEDLDELNQGVELSSNLRYLTFPNRFNHNEKNIYDIKNNEWVPTGNTTSSVFENENYFYVTPDLKYALISKQHDEYCGKYATPVSFEVFYSFDINKEQKIVSAPRGFTPDPRAAVIDNNSETLAIYEKDYEDIVNIALVTSEKEFIKYIHVNDIPETFVDGDKYLAFMENTKVLLYNTIEEVFEVEFGTGMNDTCQVDFIDKNGGRIIISRPDRIEIHSYPELNIEHEIDLNSKALTANDIVVNAEGQISFYYDRKIIKIDAYTGNLTQNIVQNLPEGYKYEDITSDGRYMLFSKDRTKTLVYDSETFEEIYNYDAKDDIIGGSSKINRGFLGNHQIIWYSYENNPVDREMVFMTYDFVLDKKSESFYHIGPFISKKGNLFATFYCSNNYKLNEIRDPITSVEEDIKQANIAYPNPTEGIINLKPDEYKSNISIYDAFGNKVYSSNPVDISSSYEIDISHLSDGIYFLVVDNKVQKIIKK